MNSSEDLLLVSFMTLVGGGLFIFSNIPSVLFLIVLFGTGISITRKYKAYAKYQGLLEAFLLACVTWALTYAKMLKEAENCRRGVGTSIDACKFILNNEQILRLTLEFSIGTFIVGYIIFKVGYFLSTLFYKKSASRK
ncbi:MAG: hypothetical protein NUV98_01345 [Candidatus Roizmanbacteria bacterium]|nr:hypothetical protein [Candidatus Roizmanbacteria bacterium]